jgi:hypothetical protein
MIIMCLYLMIVVLCLWGIIAIIGKILGMPIKGIKIFVEWIIKLINDLIRG